MEREFVPYELTVKLKALGFDEPCFGYYHICDGYTKGYAFCYFNEPERYNSETACLAPTFSQAFRWFREKYQFLGTPNWYSSGFYCYTIKNITEEGLGKLFTEFPTYEEAELACLEKLIEVVESKSK